jgi:hypothetical protein
MDANETVCTFTFNTLVVRLRYIVYTLQAIPALVVVSNTGDGTTQSQSTGANSSTRRRTNTSRSKEKSTTKSAATASSKSTTAPAKSTSTDKNTAKATTGPMPTVRTLSDDHIPAPAPPQATTRPSRARIPTERVLEKSSLALQAEVTRIVAQEKRARREEVRTQRTNEAATVEQDGDTEEIRRLRGELLFVA